MSLEPQNWCVLCTVPEMWCWTSSASVVSKHKLLFFTSMTDDDRGDVNKLTWPSVDVCMFLYALCALSPSPPFVIILLLMDGR